MDTLTTQQVIQYIKGADLKDLEHIKYALESAHDNAVNNLHIEEIMRDIENQGYACKINFNATIPGLRQLAYVNTTAASLDDIDMGMKRAITDFTQDGWVTRLKYDYHGIRHISKSYWLVPGHTWCFDKDLYVCRKGTRIMIYSRKFPVSPNGSSFDIIHTDGNIHHCQIDGDNIFMDEEILAPIKQWYKLNFLIL